MKRKYPDLWQGFLEVNLQPKEAAHIIVDIALKEAPKFKGPRTAQTLQ